MTSTAAEQSSRASELYERLRAARARSEELFGIVHPGALYDRPVPERHRTIFYMGHLEAFDWNLLREPLGLSSFDPKFDQLFAFGIDPVDGGLPTDQPAEWPSVDTVREYNRRLRDLLNAAIRDAGADDPELARNDLGRLLGAVIEDRTKQTSSAFQPLRELSGMPNRA